MLSGQPRQKNIATAAIAPRATIERKRSSDTQPVEVFEMGFPSAAASRACHGSYSLSLRYRERAASRARPEMNVAKTKMMYSNNHWSSSPMVSHSIEADHWGRYFRATAYRAVRYRNCGREGSP